MSLASKAPGLYSKNHSRPMSLTTGVAVHRELADDAFNTLILRIFLSQAMHRKSEGEAIPQIRLGHYRIWGRGQWRQVNQTGYARSNLRRGPVRPENRRTKKEFGRSFASQCINFARSASCKLLHSKQRSRGAAANLFWREYRAEQFL
jgi:hypothetical protein